MEYILVLPLVEHLTVDAWAVASSRSYPKEITPEMAQVGHRVVLSWKGHTKAHLVDSVIHSGRTTFIIFKNYLAGCGERSTILSPSFGWRIQEKSLLPESA